MPVSIFGISSGAATAVKAVNASMDARSGRQPAHVGDAPGHRGGGDHGGTHDMGERAAALTAFEIAVGGRRAALAGSDKLAVGPVAHGAAGVPPFQAGIAKNPVEPLG